MFSGGVPKQTAAPMFRRKDRDYWTGHRAQVKLSRGLLHRDVTAGQHLERWAPGIAGQASAPELMARGDALRALMNTRGGVMQKELRKQERVARDMFAPFPIKGAGPVQRAQRARRDNLAPLMAAQNLSRRADAGIARQKGKRDTQESVSSLRVWKSIKQDLGEFPGEGWGRRRQRQAYEDAVRRFKASQPKTERRGWFDNAAHNVTRAFLGGSDATLKGIGGAGDYLSRKLFAGAGGGAYNAGVAMTPGGTIGYAAPKVTEAYRVQGTKILGGLASYPVQVVPSAYYASDAVIHGRSGELWESFKKNDPLGALLIDLNPKRSLEVAANNPSAAFTYLLPYVGVGKALGAATRAGARSRVLRGGERTFAPYFQMDKNGKKVRGPSVTFKGSQTGTRIADLLGRIGRESRTGQANYRGERAPGVAPDSEQLMTHHRKFSANLLTKGAQVAGEKARNQAIAKIFVPLREKRRAELADVPKNKPEIARGIHQSINRINDVIDLLDPNITSGVLRGTRQRRYAATMSEVLEKVRGVRITQFNERLGGILRQHLGDGVFAGWHGSKAPKAALAIMADVVQFLPADASKTRVMWQRRRDDLEAAQTFEKGQLAPPTPEQLNNARAVAAYDKLLALPADKFDAEVARARAVQADVRPIQAEFEQWAISEGIMRPNEPNARYIPAAVAQFGNHFRHDPTEVEVKPFDKSSNDYQQLLDTAEVATMRAGGLEASREPLGRLIQGLREVTAPGFWRSQDATPGAADLHLTVDKAMKQVQKLAANGQIDEAGTLIRNLKKILATHEDPAGMLNTGMLRQESRLQLNDAIGRVDSIERQVKAKKDLAAKCKAEMVAMQENSGEKMVRMDFKLYGAPISVARLKQIFDDPAMAELHGVNPILDPIFISHQFELSDQPGTYYKPMTANPTLGPSRTGESFRAGAAETGIEAVPASMRHTMTRATMAQNIRMVLEGIGYGLETRFTTWKEVDHHLKSLQRDTGTKWILLSKTKLTKLNIQIDDLLARVHGDVKLLDAKAGDFETLHHLAEGTKVQEGTDFGDGIDLIAVPAEAWKQFETLQTGGTLTRHKWGQVIVFLNQQFKRTVLPLSPMYYAGNIVDNWMRVLLSGALKPQAWLDAAAIIREVYASDNPSETLARLIPAQFMQSIDNSRVSSTVSRALEGRRPRGNELSVKGGAHSVLRGILVGWDRTTSALMQLNEVFAEGGGATRGGRAHPKLIRKGTAGIPFYSIGPTVLAAAIVHRRLLTETAQQIDDFHRIGSKALAAQAVGKTAESQTYLVQAYNLIQEIMGRYDGETAATKVLLRTVLPFFQFGRNAAIFTYLSFPFQHPFAFSVVMNLEAMLQEELQDAGNTQDALNRDSPKEVRNREGVRIAPNQRIDLTRFTSFSAGVNPFMTLQSFGGPVQGALYAAGPGVKWNGQTLRGDFGAVSNTQRAEEALNSLLGSLLPGYALAARIVRGGESINKPGLAGYWQATDDPKPGDGITNTAWWKMLGLPRKYYDDPTGRNLPPNQQTPEQFRQNYIDPPKPSGVDLRDPNLSLQDFLRELHGPPSRQGR